MVLEEIPNFWQWLLPADGQLGFLATLLLILPLLGLIGAFACYLISAGRYGPVDGFYVVARTIRDAVADLFRLSPRRTWAMARLAMQESLRRRVLIVFAIFVVLLLFAGWFLDVDSDHPARLYLSFVLTSSTYLVLLLALFLSTFSLPNDIKNRTIYTVVTKPVRSSEIVLGRIIGFSTVASGLLVVMCVVSYMFVVRGLDHDHAIDDADLVRSQAGAVSGQSSLDSHHRHEYVAGKDRTEAAAGHFHMVETFKDHYVVSEPRGMLQARVPIYGSLRFLDRGGQPARMGINVGEEWMYRSYIEGRTLAAAIWTFSGITEERFPEGLPLELNLRVFRTYKGDIVTRVAGSIFLKNPDTSLQSAPRIFTSQEFTTQQLFIPRELESVDSDGQIRKIDLFEDLVDDGQVEIWIRCEEASQYFGMAQPDLYIRAADQPFWWNFAKGYVTIWLQMIVVTCFGVMFSTFLNGAVAMMATLASVVLGFYAQFVTEVARGEVQGGGPIESFVRIVTQKNLQTELEIGVGGAIIEWIDWALMLIMRAFSSLVPDYEQFQTGAYVAYGYNIPGSLLAQHLVMTAVYVIVISIIGYFFLKTREIAA